MKDFVEEIYGSVLARSRNIASICSHYFEEENVDLQYNDFNHVFSRLKEYNIYDIVQKELLYSNNDLLELYEELQLENTPSSKRKILLQENFDAFKDFYKICLPAKILSLSKPNILIKIPETTITNELNESQKIYDLFFKLEISENRLNSLKLNRTTFQSSHFSSSYMHSHSSSDYFMKWNEPCFGNGPIRSVVANCKSRITDDLILQLCLEIQRYSQIESIAGGPYIKMANISDSKLIKKLHDIKTEISLTQTNSSHSVVTTNKTLLARIIKNNVLRSFNIDGFDIVGTEFKDAAFAITKEYLLLLKETITFESAHKIVSSLVDNKVLIPYDIDNGKIKTVTFESGSSGRDDFHRDGEKMFTFKGEMTYLKILNNMQEQNHAHYILHPDIILSIINTIYKLQIKTYAQHSHKYTTKRITTL